MRDVAQMQAKAEFDQRLARAAPASTAAAAVRAARVALNNGRPSVDDQRLLKRDVGKIKAKARRLLRTAARAPQ